MKRKKIATKKELSTPLIRPLYLEDYKYVLGQLFLSPHNMTYQVFLKDQEKFTSDFNDFYKKDTNPFHLNNLLYSVNTCRLATTCIKSCSGGEDLNGELQYRRALKTAFYYYDKITFMLRLEKDIKILSESAIGRGYRFCMALNCSSGINFDEFVARFHQKYPSTVEFFDYTNDMLVKRSTDYYKTISIHSYSQFEYFIENQIYDRVNGCMITKNGFHDKLLDHPIFTDLILIDGENPLRNRDPEGGLVIIKAKRSARNEVGEMICNNWTIFNKEAQK